MNQNTSKYTSGAIAFHWVIALLVIVNIGLAILTEDLSKVERGYYMDFHKAVGISILFLSLGRLVWRLTHTPPPLPASTPGWQRMLSKLSHFLFYALIIGLPLGGWLWMSTYPGNLVSYFGLFDVPALPVQGQKALGDFLHEGHEIGGKVMIGLIVLHLGAVAKHHIIDKHNLLGRMLPG